MSCLCLFDICSFGALRRLRFLIAVIPGYFIYSFFLCSSFLFYEYMSVIEIVSFPASILYKSIAGRDRPVSYPDGPITARYRFI